VPVGREERVLRHVRRGLGFAKESKRDVKAKFLVGEDKLIEGRPVATLRGRYQLGIV
jgi:hypothetical protein